VKIEELVHTFKRHAVIQLKIEPRAPVE